MSRLAATSKFFSAEQLASLNGKSIPQHIAIIPDGNRRWAHQQLQTVDGGHQHGADVVMDTVEAAKDLGVQTLTIYTFSTENWSRPPLEIEGLMAIIDGYLRRQCDRMVREGVRLNTIGDLSKLPQNLQETIATTKAATQHCRDINLVLALNYGARDEICRVAQQIVKEVQDGTLTAEEITEASVAAHLDTAPWGDPQLLIRTSGEMRVSNFLLWQISYCEVYIPKVLWPDFSSQHLYDAVVEYQRRERREGM